MTKDFKQYAMDENNPDYHIATHRTQDLYQRRNDLRSDFGRDYTRIIFSEGYRRLKRKTQVFFAVENDHICTRSEHVNLVESVSHTIASRLGLNTELTKAIAVGHDLGHAPFGHGGERIISTIAKEHGLDSFWHEKNSLHFVDHIELLEDNNHNYHNLNLTYAVRDGIISHCGEVNQQYIQKRDEAIDLNTYKHAGQYNPWTYEGCVVKMSDKIAYLARDIEDALTLELISNDDVERLRQELNQLSDYTFNAINNGSIVNYFIQNVVDNSSVENGIGLSKEALNIMKHLMKFNYENIYLIKRVEVHTQYVELILNSLFNILNDCMIDDDPTIQLDKELKHYPKLVGNYIKWLKKYSSLYTREKQYQNVLVYDFKHDKDAITKSILDYLAGMTDTFILQLFNEIISF